MWLWALEALMVFARVCQVQIKPDRLSIVFAEFISPGNQVPSFLDKL